MSTNSLSNGRLAKSRTAHGKRFPILASALWLVLVPLGCEEHEPPSGDYQVVDSKGTSKELLREVQQPRVNAPTAPNQRAARFAWEDPVGFVSRTPPASMQGFVHDFLVAPKEGEESHDTLITSFFMGTGTIEANVARWAGQFQGAQVARQERIELPSSLPAFVLDVGGQSYDAASRLWSAGGPSPVRAIFLAIEHPAGGILSLRFIGPPEGIERHLAAFWKTVETLRPIG